MDISNYDESTVPLATKNEGARPLYKMRKSTGVG
jgi:hypothetical protein